MNDGLLSSGCGLEVLESAPSISSMIAGGFTAGTTAGVLGG